MKKIYFILAAAAMFLAVDANAQLGVGIGYNLLNTTQRLGDETDDDSLNGFYAEVTYDFNFLEKNWGSLGLQPAIRYTFGGETESDEVLGVTTRASLAEHYLDVPVNVKYAYDAIPSKLEVYGFAGPVFSFGLASSLSASVIKVSISCFVRTGYLSLSSSLLKIKSRIFIIGYKKGLVTCSICESKGTVSNATF